MSATADTLLCKTYRDAAGRPHTVQLFDVPNRLTFTVRLADHHVVSMPGDEAGGNWDRVAEIAEPVACGHLSADCDGEWRFLGYVPYADIH